VRFVAAYPLTPATELLEWMSPALAEVGGTLVQAEDELASINMAIGGSYGGVPSLTATSGPGLSLMIEALGLAVTAEIPIVVVDVMRVGPSTGIPTKSEQGDLNIAVHGLHGDAPHLVLACNSVADCLGTTQWAVQLAEALQSPAIVLSDQFLGQARSVVDRPDDRAAGPGRVVAEIPVALPRPRRWADLDGVERRLKRAQSAAKSGNAEAKAEASLCERLTAHLGDQHVARSLPMSDDEAALLKTLNLLTAKPVLYCCNVDEDSLPDGNAYSDLVRERARVEKAEVVVVCGKIEEELSTLEASEKLEMLQAYGMTEPALAQLTRACYKLLGLQSYFTAGVKEIRAWTVKVGATAPQAAGVIHSDFERGFIRANTYALADLEEYHTEAAIKSAGRMRAEGKEYVMQDGDIVHFLFNV
jgi:hypothetical protein